MSLPHAVREQQLRQACLIRRRTARRSPPSSRRSIVDPTGLTYFAAKRRVERPELARHLTWIGERAFLLGWREQLVRELLLAASAGGASEEHVSLVARLLELDGYHRYAGELQIAVARAVGRLAQSRPLAMSLLHLVETGTLELLSIQVRNVLLRQLQGPAGPLSRRSALLAWHERRASEIHELAERMQRESTETLVVAYLDEVVRPLHILRSPRDLDLAIVVFGDPADPASLSYQKSAELDAAGRIEIRVATPDPRVRSRWSAGALANDTFECRTAALSRWEELELIGWLENSQSVALDFERAAEEVARILASRRGPLEFATTARVHGRKR